MGIALAEAEMWAFLSEAHTGILTTLRADGWPVPLPVWFVAMNHAVYVRTPARSRKARRATQDTRAAFVVEDGLHWKELRAVVLMGSIRQLPDDHEWAEPIQQAFDQKYREFRTAPTGMATSARAHYSTPFVTLELLPEERTLSWDNSKLAPKPT